MIGKLIFVLTLFTIGFCFLSTASFAKDTNKIRVIVGNIPTDDFPFYCQYGDTNKDGELTRYHSWNYRTGSGSYCDIAGHGCAMTALAMIKTYFGDKTTPSEAAKENRNIGCFEGGTYNSDINEVIRPKLMRDGYVVTSDLVNRDFNSTGGYTGTANLRLLKTFLDRGYVIWAGGRVRYAGSTSGAWYGPGGHAFVITSVDVGAQTVTGYDPTFCNVNYKRLSGGKRVFRNVNSIGEDFACTIADGRRTCGWTMLYAIKKR